MDEEFTSSNNVSSFGFTGELNSGLVSSFGYLFFIGTDPSRITDLEDRTASLLIEQFQFARGE